MSGLVRDVHRGALYRSAINLWVEDKLTSEYLSAVWNDSRVFLLIGGGVSGVRAIVHDASTSDFPSVFGLSDRDFGPSNKERWLNSESGLRTFVLPVHEIENYLLDPEAMAASAFHNRNLPVSEIQELLDSAAKKLIWWQACRSVLVEMKQGFQENFVPDPKIDKIHDVDSAIAHIESFHWFENVEEQTKRCTRDQILQQLHRSHTRALSQFQSGEWKTEYSGKEIFRDVGGRICDRPRLGNKNPSNADFFIDVEKISRPGNRSVVASRLIWWICSRHSSKRSDLIPKPHLSQTTAKISHAVVVARKQGLRPERSGGLGPFFSEVAAVAG